MKRIVLAFVLLAACDRPAPPPPPPPPLAPPSASASVAAVVDAAPPAEPTLAFEPVVGDWSLGEAAGVKGTVVDGSKWRDGTPSANLADQAKRLYGERYAEFLDGVKTFAFFPLAIAKEPPPEGDLRIRTHFYPIAGKIDQGAGIAFAIAPDGSYLGVRANALEDNILFFKVVKGKRTVLDNVRNVPTPTRTWHTLTLEIRGKKITVDLDGTKRFEKTLESAPTGRVGLWSKADSQVLFETFEVTKL
jgi:hypothetical protein